MSSHGHRLDRANSPPRYEPPTPRPAAGQRVYEHVYEGRSGEVVRIIRDPRVSRSRRLQYVFVVRWWTPWKRRHGWSCHTSHEWDLGTVRPGRRPRKLAPVPRTPPRR